MRYGYFRIYIMLRRKGWLVNHKRVYRLYRQDGLSLRLKKPRRNISAGDRVRQPAAAAPNEMWSMDFVSSALFDGRRLRALTAVDTYPREALAIDVDQGIKGEQVFKAMARIAGTRGSPKGIRVDNGPEFISKALDRWAYENGVTLDFSRPGKPTGNAFVESFNGRLRDECLNAHWFLSLADARAKIEAWRSLYNESWPHTSLGWLTPNEYAAAATLRAAERSLDSHLQAGGKSGGPSNTNSLCLPLNEKRGSRQYGRPYDPEDLAELAAKRRVAVIARLRVAAKIAAAKWKSLAAGTG